MKFYPLAKTNVKLTGQIKIDIFVTQKEDGTLYADKLKVSPISENIPFAYNSTDDEIIYSHKYNIRNVKNYIGNKFYSISPKYSNEQFIIDNNIDNEKLITDYQYDRRIDRCSVDKYGEQCHFFIPIWIQKDDENDIDTIEDCFNKYSFSLKLGNENGNIKKINFGDKFIKYLTDFYENVDLSKMIYIDIKNHISYIYGLDVNDSEFKKIDISSITNNLLDRERPLIEQNYIITNAYERNNLIAPQILNLNFILSPTLLIPDHNIKEFNSKEIKLSLIIKDKDNEIPLKDFFTNQYDIPKLEIDEYGIIKDCNEPMLESYKEKYIYELSHTNKINPTICHWSLNSFSPGFFNLHSDFAVHYINGDKSKNIPYQIDYNNSESTISNNILQFANILDKEYQNIYEYDNLKSNLKDNNNYLFSDKDEFKKENYTLINNSELKPYWINGNKLPCLFESNNKNVYLKIILYSLKEGDNDKCLEIIKVNTTTDIDVYNFLINKKLFEDKNKNYKGLISLFEKEDKIWKEWFKRIKESQKINRYILRKSIRTELLKLNNDFNDIKIVSYNLYKNNNSNIEIDRICGSIYPFLIDVNSEKIFTNRYNYIRSMNQENFNKQYNIYINSRLKPKYIKNDIFYSLKDRNIIETENSEEEKIYNYNNYSENFNKFIFLKEEYGNPKNKNKDKNYVVIESNDKITFKDSNPLKFPLTKEYLEENELLNDYKELRDNIELYNYSIKEFIETHKTDKNNQPYIEYTYKIYFKLK